jgi:hypothetical protein
LKIPEAIIGFDGLLRNVLAKKFSPVIWSEPAQHHSICDRKIYVTDIVSTKSFFSDHCPGELFETVDFSNISVIFFIVERLE